MRPRDQSVRLVLIPIPLPRTTPATHSRSRIIPSISPAFPLDPRGAGESDKPDGSYSTELLADDVAAFMAAIGVESAHVSGLSLGGAIGLWVASKHPERVKSLSLHSCWPRSDPFLKAIVENWQIIAKVLWQRA